MPSPVRKTSVWIPCRVPETGSLNTARSLRTFLLKANAEPAALFNNPGKYITVPCFEMYAKSPLTTVFASKLGEEKFVGGTAVVSFHCLSVGGSGAS